MFSENRMWGGQRPSHKVWGMAMESGWQVAMKVGAGFLGFEIN